MTPPLPCEQAFSEIISMHVEAAGWSAQGAILSLWYPTSFCPSICFLSRFDGSEKKILRKFFDKTAQCVYHDRVFLHRFFPVSQIKKLEQALDSTVGRASMEYAMIEANDRVMVAISGGKDSWALLATLMRLKKKAPIPFTLFAVHVDAGFPDTGDDTRTIDEYLTKLDVEHEILPTGIYRLMEMKVKPGSNPCGFCSRMRRGALYSRAKQGDITKIALGHHREDAIETLLLNLFFAGQIRSLAPKYITDDGAHTVIRPMILTPEYKINSYVREAGFPIIENCPFHDKTSSRRASMRALVSDLKKENPRVVKSILRALSNVDPNHLWDKRLLDTKAIRDDDH